MNNKILWIDIETTGLVPEINGIREIACLMEIDGEIVDTFEIKMNPFTYNQFIMFDDRALELSNVTIEEVQDYPFVERQFELFINWIGKYIDKPDKKDRLQIAGFKTSFDTNFLKILFEDQNNEFYFSYFHRQELDVLAYARMLGYYGNIAIDSYSLVNLCKHYGIAINAHKALSDIRATWTLAAMLKPKWIVSDK